MVYELQVLKVSIAPPIGEIKQYFFHQLRVHPCTPVPSLVSIGRCVPELWRFLWNRPHPQNFGRRLYRNGAVFRKTAKLVVCRTVHRLSVLWFGEDWPKCDRGIAKKRFWTKFKMAENLVRRKWAWPISVDAGGPRESRKKRILIVDPTVQKLWTKT